MVGGTVFHNFKLSFQNIRFYCPFKNEIAHFMVCVRWMDSLGMYQISGLKTRVSN